MAEKIMITADSTCDLSPELVARYNVTIMPLIINMNDKSYRDGVDIVPEDIYRYADESGQLPTTSAIPVAVYEDFFRPYVADGYKIIHINISSGFSCTHQNAMIAAEELEGVYPIDSRNLSTGSGLVVIEAAIRRDQGMPAEEIVKELTEDIIPKVEASFVVDTLKYLRMGGRCSSVAALGANLLKLKPCIEVTEGKMGVGKKYRGNIGPCLLSYVRERLEGRTDLRTDRIFITHSGSTDEDVEAVRQLVAELCDFGEILITRAGCTVSTHCGPATLGVLFIRK